MTQKKTDYNALNIELDEILSKLQQDDIDVDEAMQLYERGLKLTKEMESYLKDAENKVAKIKADFS